MDSIGDFAKQTALQAGKLLVDRFVPFGINADPKPDDSLVTEADLEADDLIATAIHARFPGDLILSEESNTHSGEEDLPIWIIDPLDGTTNYSLGLPIWGVSIARVVSGFPQHAALYFPMLNELYTAEAGRGAQLNGIPLGSQQGHHTHASFFACCSRTAKNYPIKLPYKTRILGSAAYNLCCIARHSAIMSLEVTPKIWDLAAGWLLVEEAECSIGVIDGPMPFPLRSNFRYTDISFPTIAAIDEKYFAKLREELENRPV